MILHSENDDDDDDDEKLVYRSLLDVNLPKIHPNDWPVFKSIIEDLFPGSAPEKKDFIWLREIFESECKEKNFQIVDELFMKLIETYEMMGFRHSLMLIGNPYTGKSFILKVLVKALIASQNSNVVNVDCGKYYII